MCLDIWSVNSAERIKRQRIIRITGHFKKLGYIPDYYKLLTYIRATEGINYNSARDYCIEIMANLQKLDIPSDIDRTVDNMEASSG